MARKLHDQYFKKAKQEGYFARSAYKLEQINSRYRLFRAGSAVLDLGSSPGSWLQYARKVVGEKGALAGVDIAPVKPSILALAHVLIKDIADCVPEDFASVATVFDVVMSDMAPKTCGVRAADQARSLELCELAFAFAQKVLKPGGHFVVKVFESPEVRHFTKAVKAEFKEVAFFKPPATRKESFETYLVAKGYHVKPAPEEESGEAADASAKPSKKYTVIKHKKKGPSRKRKS